MDVIYQLSQATVTQVMERLPDPPSYSAVRAMMRILEDKSILIHHQDGPRYVYRPTVPHEQATKSALNSMLTTFFEGSTERAVAALLDMDDAKLNKAELDRLARLIEKAREEEQ